MFDVYIKNYMNGSTKVMTETKMLSVPLKDAETKFINKPILNLDWSATGSFDFEIEPRSPFYNSFLHLRTIIRVEYDGDTIFRGRVLTIGNTMWGTKRIKCEDQYGFFRDAQHEGVADEKRSMITLSSYVRSLIDDYNRQMANEPDKMFYVGEIPGNYSSSITADQRCPDISEKFGSSSWQEIKACLDDVGSGYGGHWRVRYVGGRAYLDLLKNYFNATINSQPIELKKNLLDLSNNYQVDNIFTVVIPLGSSESSTTGNTTTTVTTTISGYNTHLHESNYIKVPDLLNIFSASELNSGYHTLEDYRDAIANYGMIFKTVSFGNADSPALLWDYATDWIKNNYIGAVSDFSIKVVDFHQLGEMPSFESSRSTQKFMVGDRVRVIYPIFVNGERQLKEEIMTIKGISYDLYNPENTTLTIGIPSDLLDHEYGQKKTKAKKTKSKDNSSGTTVPKGGGGGKHPTKINIHKWIRATIAHEDWGDARLKSVTTYVVDKSQPQLTSFSLPTYKVASYTGIDEKTYNVALNRSGFFVCDPSRNNLVVRWIATGDAEGNQNIQGVTINFDKDFNTLLELCKYDGDVEVDLTSEASVVAGVTIAKDPDDNVTMSVVKTVRVHYSVKEAICKLGTFGNKNQIYGTYQVIYPSPSTGTGFKRIASFEDIHGVKHYVLLGTAGIGVSIGGTNVDTWLFRTASDGKLTIGGYTFDMNNPAEVAAIEAAAAKDTEANITIASNGSVKIATAGDTSSGETGETTIELNPNGGTAGFGKKQDGSWFIKLNDTVTYTDKDGNVRTASGFITADDINVPEIPSFKTKLAVMDELIAARATIGELTAYQLAVNTKFNDVERDLIDKGASIAKINSDITIIGSELTQQESDILANASAIAGHQVTLTKIGTDITTINSDITDLDGELLAQGKTITKIGSDVTVIGGNLTEAQAEIAANGQSITAINSDIVDITGELRAAKARIDTLEAVDLKAEIAKINMVNVRSISGSTSDSAASFGNYYGNHYYFNMSGGGGSVWYRDVKDGIFDLSISLNSSTNVYTLKKTNYAGMESDVGTFSRATKLSGSWASGKFTVSASPQNSSYYTTIDSVLASGAVTYDDKNKILSVPINVYTKVNSTTNMVNSGFSANFPVAAGLAYNDGRSNGWTAARGKVSLPGSGSGTSITPKWPSATIDKQESRTYELTNDGNNAVVLRYNTATSGQPNYVTAARFTHNKYSTGYTAGETAGKSAGEETGKTTGWNLARGKVSLPGSGSGSSVTPKWPGASYNSQESRTYELTNDGNNTVVLRYNSATSGQPNYVTAARFDHNKYSAGYTDGWDDAYPVTIGDIDAGNVSNIGTNRGNRAPAGAIGRPSANSYIGFSVTVRGTTKTYYITVNS